MSESVDEEGFAVNQGELNVRSIKNLAGGVRALTDEQIAILFNQAMAYRQRELQELNVIGQTAQRSAIMELVEEKKAETEAETEESPDEE